MPIIFFIGARRMFYRILIAVLGVLLVFFGGKFVFSTQYLRLF